MRTFGNWSSCSTTHSSKEHYLRRRLVNTLKQSLDSMTQLTLKSEQNKWQVKYCRGRITEKLAELKIVMQRSSEANEDSLHNLKDKSEKAFPLWKKKTKQKKKFPPPYWKKTSKTFSASLGMRIITDTKMQKEVTSAFMRSPLFKWFLVENAKPAFSNLPPLRAISKAVLKFFLYC